jgi:hypothetical protein
MIELFYFLLGLGWLVFLVQFSDTLIILFHIRGELIGVLFSPAPPEVSPWQVCSPAISV